MSEIEVVDLSHLTPTDVKKLRILDNKIVSNEYDDELLNAEIKQIAQEQDAQIAEICDGLGLKESEIIELAMKHTATPIESKQSNDYVKDDGIPAEIRRDFEKVGEYDFPQLVNNEPIQDKKIITYNGENEHAAAYNLFIHGSYTIRRIKIPENVIYAFYTDDSRFKNIFENINELIDKLSLSGINTLISPNFSCYAFMPMAEKIYNLYKSRVMAYSLQQNGFNVIYDINFTSRMTDFFTDGLPEEINTAAFQTQQIKTKDDIEILYEGMDTLFNEIKINTMLIYGGNNKNILM